MPGFVQFDSGARGAAADALIANLDAPVAQAYAELYAGTVPSSITTALTTQTLLATLTSSADPSATQAGGVVTFNPWTQDNEADATGTATFLLIYRGDGTKWMICDVGAIGSGAIATMTSTSVIAGAPVRINAFTITVG